MTCLKTRTHTHTEWVKPRSLYTKSPLVCYATECERKGILVTSFTCSGQIYLIVLFTILECAEWVWQNTEAFRAAAKLAIYYWYHNKNRRPVKLVLSLSPVTGGKQAELFSVQGARDFENLKKKKGEPRRKKKREREVTQYYATTSTQRPMAPFSISSRESCSERFSMATRKSVCP